MKTLRVFRKLMSHGKKVAKHRGYLYYNHSCIRKGVLPRSLQFKSHINTTAGKKLAKKFGFKYLKLLINESQSHHWIRIYEVRIFSILRQYSAFMSEEFFNVIKLRIESMKQKSYANLLSYYEKKLEKQLGTGTRSIAVTPKNKWVINLSKHKLFKEENDVLSRGLNFAIVTNYIPKQQILAEVEIGIQRLPENIANLIRNQTINILNQKQNLQSNLNLSEIKGSNNLTKNVEIRIRKADKGNSTVTLDKTDYDHKMLSLLNDESTYRILNRDLTKCIKRRLNSFIYNLFESQHITQTQCYHLRSTDATAPRLYGLPKIHKKGISIRPIVSFINSPS